MKLFGLIIALILSVSVIANNDKDGNEKTSTSAITVSTTIKGQIIDKTTGDALTGVTVKLNDGREVYTDFDGNFIFNNCNSGKYQISTSLISYENIVIDNISVNNNKTKRLTIEMSNL